MAKLPTSVDLGPAPTADATEPVANYAAGADLVGKGAQALAAGIDKLGAGAESVSVDQQRYQFAMAHSTLLANLTNLGEQTKSDTTWGPDASGKWLVNRHAESAWGLQDEAAKSIASGPMRERFMATTAPAIQESIARADAHATGLRNSQSIADWSNPAIINSVVNAPDDATRRTMIDNHNVALDSLVKLGVVHPDVAQKMGQEWTQKVATTKALASINSGDTGQMTATIRELQQPPGSDAAITSQIVKIEGQGKNPLSSAQGVGQFTNQTWLDTVKSARPDLAQGKTDTDILALRNDPNLAWQMTDALRKQNVSYLQSKGLPTTPGAQYLAHFLGPKGAEGVLGADPNMPVSDALVKAVGPTRAAQMIAANPTVLGGKLVGSLTQWADNKMGGAHGGSLYDVLPPETREQIIGHLQTAVKATSQDQERQLKLAQEQAKVVSDHAEGGIRQTIYGAGADATKLPSARDIVNNPSLTREAQDRLIKLVQDASGDKHDLNTYGASFNDLFNKVHAPQGDPNRITDPTALYGYVGKGLTVSGLKELEGEITARRTPDGEAEAAMKTQFFKNAKAQISGTDEGLHLKDPKGDELYLRFMAQALPAYEAGKKKGLTPTQMLSPDSPDYLGKSVTQFKRPMTQWYSDMISGGAAATPTAATDFGTPQALIAAVQSGKLPRAEGEKIALQKGWIRPTPPPPAPTPTVPMSQ